jgi:hypothetical protein
MSPRPTGPHRPPCSCMPLGEVRETPTGSVIGLGPVAGPDGRCHRCFGWTNHHEETDR